MIFDIIIVILVIAAGVLGFRSGFLRTFLHTAGWLIAIVLSFVWSPKFKAFLMDKTDFYDSLYNNFFEKFSEAIPNAQVSYDSLPNIIGKTFNSLIYGMADAMAGSFASLIFTIISFLAVLLFVKLILWLLTSTFAKNSGSLLSGSIDGGLGLIFGFIQGFILVYVLLALLIPVCSLATPEHTQTILDIMKNSYIAEELYNNNLIMLIIRDIIIP